MAESDPALIAPTPQSRTDGTALPDGPTKPGWRRGAGLIYFAISAALLIALYRSIDARQVASSLVQADRLWLTISVAMILPITVLRAVRFLWVAPRGVLPGLAEALRLTLVSSALNVFLPAKSGDLIKSYVVARRSPTSAGVAVSIIVYERLCDFFSLMTWCVIGWLVGRPEGHSLPSFFWPAVGAVAAFCGVLITSDRASQVPRIVAGLALHGPRLQKIRALASGWPDLMVSLRGRRRKVVPFSLALWLMHLTQIWMFTIALSVEIPFAVCVSLAAVALMAGQVPLTIAGLGARDVALVVLMAGYMSAESAAALGVLIATRNLLPPLLGVPFIRSYLATIVADARRSQQAWTRADA
jgi:glycosyltransferase 2 family protein